jgi:hypothetical protein
LEEDLASGIWKRNNRDILNSSFIDAGYRLVSAKVRQS